MHLIHSNPIQAIEMSGRRVNTQRIDRLYTIIWRCLFIAKPIFIKQYLMAITIHLEKILSKYSSIERLWGQLKPNMRFIKLQNDYFKFKQQDFSTIIKMKLKCANEDGLLMHHSIRPTYREQNSSINCLKAVTTSLFGTFFVDQIKNGIFMKVSAVLIHSFPFQCKRHLN